MNIKTVQIMSIAVELYAPILAFFVENPPVPNVEKACESASIVSIPKMRKRIVCTTVSTK